VREQVRASVRGGPSRLRPWAEKGGGRPVKAKEFIFFSESSNKYAVLSNKNSFSQVDPKTKVIQNFILYNIALGFILKF
jgi:hypothetical protein